MAVDEPVGITKYFKKKETESPPPPKRAPSPPHEYVLADNPDIAVSILRVSHPSDLTRFVAVADKLANSSHPKFIVMFRARFHDAFPRSTPHYGPQDIERGVAEMPPGDHIERLLAALLGLVLNRKKDVEYDHAYLSSLPQPSQVERATWSSASLPNQIPLDWTVRANLFMYSCAVAVTTHAP